MLANPTHHICPDCFYTWAHGQDGSHSCIQQLRRYKLPADVRLPGGMTISRGCELNTVLLALRHREAGEAWQTSFDAPIPVDGQLQQMIRALPAQTMILKEADAIAALPVERDELGHWTHPAWPQDGEENAIPKSWFKDKGLQVVVVEFEHDAPEELADRYFENGQPEACKDWKPSQPKGEGWFVFSIHETDDGPVCVWVRPSQPLGIDSEGGSHD